MDVRCSFCGRIHGIDRSEVGRRAARFRCTYCSTPLFVHGTTSDTASARRPEWLGRETLASASIVGIGLSMILYAAMGAPPRPARAFASGVSFTAPRIEAGATPTAT